MARRIDESVWNERQDWVRKQQESGLSVARFCRENGLHLGNFHAWRRRLGLASKPVATEPRHTNDRKAPIAFVQVPLSTQSTHSAAWIEVSMADGMVIRIPASNLAALETVIGSLQQSAREGRHA